MTLRCEIAQVHGAKNNERHACGRRRADGAVLPVLHLNGYKIANPTVLARIPEDELAELIRGYGYTPHFVGGDDPMAVHVALAATLDAVLDHIATIQRDARASDGSAHTDSRTTSTRPPWP